MKKLLIINTSCNSGSTGRIAEEIGQVAISRGYESYFAYGRNGLESQSHLIRIGNDWDVRKHVISTRLFDNHGFSSTNATKKLISRIDEIKPDIINLHNIHGYYLNIEVLFKYLAAKDIPVVWTLHDCWPFTGHCSYYDRYQCDKWKTCCYNCPNKNGYPTSWILDKSRHNYLTKKILFNSVSNITFVPVCHWMEENVKQSFLGQYPVKMIFNGVDVDVFKPQSNNKTKEKLDIKNGNKVILGVASTWDARKGFNDFIQLRSLLNDNYTFILVGLSEKQIKSLPKGIMVIRRTENVKQLAEIYSLADVFVNPTYVDNFPTTNIEALACGTPVATYRTGGSPEAVDEHTGLVAEKGDINQLLSHIVSLAERKSKCTEICRKRAVELYNKQDRFNDYVDLFDSLIKK